MVYLGFHTKSPIREPFHVTENFTMGWHPMFHLIFHSKYTWQIWEKTKMMRRKWWKKRIETMWRVNIARMIMVDDQDVWSWRMIRMYDHGGWSGCMIMVDDQDVWSGCMIMADDQDVWSGCMIRMYDQDVWSWRMIRMYDHGGWSGCMIMADDQDVWSWWMIRMYDQDVWSGCNYDH